MTGGVEKRCGCPEPRWPKCPHPAWYLKDFQYLGKVYRDNLTRYARVVLSKTITTKTEAEGTAEILRGHIIDGTYVSARQFRPAPVEQEHDDTLDAVAEAFAVDRIDADQKKRPNSKVNDRAHLKRLCASRHASGKRLGTRPMAEITIKDLITFRGTCSDLANSSWNKVRTVLGQLSRYAKSVGYADIITDASHDDRRLLRRGKPAQRTRRIGQDLLANIMEAAREIRIGEHGSRLLALIVAGLETGFRIGELLALQWRDVDLVNRKLTNRGTEIGSCKTAGSRRSVRISQPLYELLLTMGRDPAGQPLKLTAYVFGTPYGERIKTIDKAWNTVVLRAHNIEPTWNANGDFDTKTRAILDDLDYNFNDIRHEAACRWDDSGEFRLKQVSERLGHTNLATTSIYLHSDGGAEEESQDSYDQARGYKVRPAAAAATALTSHRAPSQHKASTNARDAATACDIPRVIKRSKS